MPSIINLDDGQFSGTPAIRITAAGDGVLQIQNSGNPALEVSATGELSVVHALRTNTIKSATGTSVISINDNGIAAFTQLPYQQIPIMSCGFSSQTVTNGTATLFTNETIEIDNYGWWTANDHRWTAQIPGWYEMYVYVAGAGTTNVTLVYSRIYKTGSSYASGANRTPSGAPNLGVWISRFIYLNGTTDYLQAYGQVYGSGTLTMSGHAQIKLVQRDPL